MNEFFYFFMNPQQIFKRKGVPSAVWFEQNLRKTIDDLNEPFMANKKNGKNGLNPSASLGIANEKKGIAQLTKL